jgi:hypothetical protein
MEVITIYYLHKGDGKPFYVGKSKNGISRIKDHKSTFGKNTFIEVLDEVSSIDWKFWETYWIYQLQTWGFTLNNQNEGGGGPLSHTTKSKQKISEAHKGMSHSISTKIKMSKSHQGRKFSEDTKEKIRQSKLGKSNSKLGSKDGPKPKVSEAHKGRISPNKGKGTPILQYDLEGNYIAEWNNINEAIYSLKLQISNESIRQCLKGKSKKSAGYVWKYK